MTAQIRYLRTAFAQTNGQVMRNEHARVALNDIERRLDAALYFDADDTAARLMALKLRRLSTDGALEEPQTARLKTCATRLAIDADWHLWSRDEKSNLDLLLKSPLFARADILNICIARESMEKPHDFTPRLGTWINEHYDIVLARHMYETGIPGWQKFALAKLAEGVESYFNMRIWARRDQVIPANWPGLVRAFAHSVAQDPAVKTGAAAILLTLKTYEDQMVQAAITKARDPFRPA